MDEEDGRSAGKGIQVSKKAMRSIDFLSKNLSKTFCFKATYSIVLFRFSWGSRDVRCTTHAKNQVIGGINIYPDNLLKLSIFPSKLALNL